MTISTTQIGTNTYQITLDGELNTGGVIAAIDSAIVNGGWTLHDSYNENTHRVYKNLCKDGTVFKYLGIFVDIATFKIYTTVYETWDNSTHAGTNEAYTYNRSGCMSFTLSACDIIVMTSPRWCILQTFIRNNPSPWSGIVECAREVAEDTALAGYPPFAWVCSLFISNDINGNKYLSFPRNRAGGTGAAAVADGIQTPFVRFGALTGLSGQILTSQSYVYPWDTNKKIVHSMRPTFGFAEMHGKIFGLKAVHNIGSPFNRVSMPIDSDYNYLSTGAETEHWVLGNTASATTLATILTTGSPTSGYHSGLSSVTLPGAGRYSIFTGTSYYVTHASGICKIDATSSTLGAVTPLAAVTGDHGDIVFDGRYAYAASVAGITRIDTTNDTVTTLALAQGCLSLFWDGTWLWASARTTLVNNAFYKINTSTFSISSTLTQINTAGSLICGMVNDFAGNLYTVGTDGKTNKIVISTGAVSTIAPSYVSTNIMSNIIYDGVNFHAAYVASTTSTTVTINSSTTPGYQEVTTGISGATINQITNCGKLLFSKLYNFYLTSVATSAPSVNYLLSARGYSSFNNAGSIASNMNSVVSDGARIFGLKDTIFYQYTGMCHPDNGATILNRLLLPK